MVAGQVLTMEPGDDVRSDVAIAVAGDRIVAVGSDRRAPRRAPGSSRARWGRVRGDPGPGQRPPAPDRRSTAALGHPRRPHVGRRDHRLGRAQPRRAHRRRRRALGHVGAGRGGHQRHHVDGRGRHRRASRSGAGGVRSGRGRRPVGHVGDRHAGAAPCRARPGRARPVANRARSDRRPLRRPWCGDVGRSRPDERRPRHRRRRGWRPSATRSCRSISRPHPPMPSRTSLAPATVRSSTSTDSGCWGRTRWRATPCTSMTPSSTCWWRGMSPSPSARGPTCGSVRASPTPAVTSSSPSRGGRLALGCDSENAGDALDVLAGGGLVRRSGQGHGDGPVRRYGDRRAASRDPRWRAGDRVCRRDRVAARRQAGRHRAGRDRASGVDAPPADPRQLLVWASGGHDVRHVVAGGRVVVRDGECTTVDRAELRTAIRARLATGWAR